MQTSQPLWPLVSLYGTHAAFLVFNCPGLMPEGPCNSLSSLALLRGNISPPQVVQHKTRLYLQRASSQHKFTMQNHAHRCTMDYIYVLTRGCSTCAFSKIKKRKEKKNLP